MSFKKKTFLYLKLEVSHKNITHRSKSLRTSKCMILLSHSDLTVSHCLHEVTDQGISQCQGVYMVFLVSLCYLRSYVVRLNLLAFTQHAVSLSHVIAVFFRCSSSLGLHATIIVDCGHFYFSTDCRTDRVSFYYIVVVYCFEAA